MMNVSPAAAAPLPPDLGADPAAAAAQAQSRRHQAIEQAAASFEGMFTSLLCKQMRESLGKDSLFGKDTGDVLGGLFDHFMGQHLAQAGGLGLGAMIRKHLEAANRR